MCLSGYKKSYCRGIVVIRAQDKERKIDQSCFHLLRFAHKLLSLSSFCSHLTLPRFTHSFFTYSVLSPGLICLLDILTPSHLLAPATKPATGLMSSSISLSLSMEYYYSTMMILLRTVLRILDIQNSLCMREPFYNHIRFLILNGTHSLCASVFRRSGLTSTPSIFFQLP